MQETKTIAAPTIESVREAYQRARKWRDAYAVDAVICGQMFAELHAFNDNSHSGTKFSIDAEPDPTLMELAYKIGGTNAKTTLYRWKGVAAAVMGNLLRKYKTLSHPIRHPEKPVQLTAPLLH